MSADLKKIVKAVQDYENARVAFEKAKQYLEDLVDPPKVTGAACGQQDYQWRLHEAQRSEMIAQQGQLGAIPRWTMTLHAPTDAVLYRWLKPKALTAGSILLTKELSKDTRWAECLVAGPDSVVKAGDEILLSARPVSYTFEIDGEIMHNTSDKSCLAYKHEGILNATGKTILYTWLEEPQEEVSAGGIVLVRKEKTKELEPRWAKVVACGPETGVQKGDEVLLAWKSDNYVLEIDGLKLHNAGAEEIIAFRR